MFVERNKLIAAGIGRQGDRGIKLNLAWNIKVDAAEQRLQKWDLLALMIT
jgi:hypothetical protein